MRTNKVKVTRGSCSLVFSGAATSADRVNRRSGVRQETGLVVVENGKRISVAELCRSVTAAANQFLYQRGIVEEGFCR